MVQYTYAVCMQRDGQFNTCMQCAYSVLDGSVHVCSVYAV